MRTLLLICSLLLVACGKSPSSLREKVAAYGERQFSEDVLASATQNLLPGPLAERFAPLQVRAHLTGVLLVYQDTDSTLAGIYVDRAKIESVGGSGLSIEPWGERVGWLEEKRRSSIK